jgi:hypothetical protein
MKAQFVFEKFEEESDPIHDMGIGDPLMRAGSYMQKYAEEHGYEFELKKIAKTESPVMYVPNDNPEIVSRTSLQGGGVICTTTFKYTITYMPHKKPNVFSLRKVWMGYAYVPTDEDLINPQIGRMIDSRNFTGFEKYKANKLRELMKKGGMKEKPLKQALMGRFSDPKKIIARIDKSIKHITQN